MLVFLAAGIESAPSLFPARMSICFCTFFTNSTTSNIQVAGPMDMHLLCGIGLQDDCGWHILLCNVVQYAALLQNVMHCQLIPSKTYNAVLCQWRVYNFCNELSGQG